MSNIIKFPEWRVNINGKKVACTIMEAILTFAESLCDIDISTETIKLNDLKDPGIIDENKRFFVTTHPPFKAYIFISEFSLDAKMKRISFKSKDNVKFPFSRVP